MTNEKTESIKPKTEAEWLELEQGEGAESAPEQIPAVASHPKIEKDPEP